MAPTSPALDERPTPRSFDRSRAQRHDALLRANAVRTYRAELKKQMHRGETRVVDVLLAGEHDSRLTTMQVFDLLLAVPKVGRVKANTILTRHRISPSKTLAGLSPRQRAELVAVLRAY